MNYRYVVAQMGNSSTPKMELLTTLTQHQQTKCVNELLIGSTSDADPITFSPKMKRV